MILNSVAFAFFAVASFFLYWLVFSKNAKSQNLFLLVASLIFYGWIDWRFLGLILFNALFNYSLGIRIFDSKEEVIKSRLLWFGIFVNLSILGFFKYFNFFIGSFFELFNLIESDLKFNPIHVILPLGISFFTFQTLCYLIDVYNDEIKPSSNFVIFTTYVVYFPKLLAGPIERAQRFLPQIEDKRIFDYNLTVDGMRQILLGLFKKIVIADSCGAIVNPIFENYSNHSGSTLLVGLFFYLFQIYCDFSGYSDIAIGVSKLFGIRLMQNFDRPFFSKNIADFWRRWHISLTSWMMDYVFRPLSFQLRKYKKAGVIISIVITFVIVGLWHGANWTYIFYGFLQGLYFIPLIFSNNMSGMSKASEGFFFSFNNLFRMSGLFVLFMITVVFFRSDSLGQAFYFLGEIFSPSLFSMPILSSRLEALFLLIFIGSLLYAEWRTRGQEHALSNLELKYPISVRWSVYMVVTIMVSIYSGEQQQFIYFQY